MATTTSNPLSGADFARFIVKVADAEQVPRRALLGMGHAESKWRSDARRPTDPARDEHQWPDVSGGGFQQTVAFSDELEAKGLDWHAYPGAAVTEEILQRYYDPDYATHVAARKLRALLRCPDVNGDHLLALYRYNKPNGTPSADVQQNYQDGLQAADDFLATLDTTEHREDAMPEETLIDLWQAVRPDIPFDLGLGIVQFWKQHWKELGSPVGPERKGPDGNTYQAFTRGILRWGAGGPVML